MSSIFQNLSLFRQKVSSLAGAMAVILVMISLFGIFICAGATMHGIPRIADHASHAMKECGANLGVNGCQMNILDHILHWQSSFTSTFDLSGVMSLLAVIIFVTVFFLQKQFLFLQQTNFSIERFQFYEQSHPEHKLFNTFSSLFSAGILHPKFHT